MFDTSSSAESAMTRFLLAEIGLPHLGISPDRLRRAGRDDAAIDQDGDPISQGGHGFHVLLDKWDGQLALEFAQGLDHARALLRPHPRHRLVEQEHARAGRQRYRDFELAVLAMAQVGDEGVGTVREPRPRECRARRLAQLRPIPCRAPKTKEGPPPRPPPPPPPFP